MYHHGKVILSIASKVGHHRFARFGVVAAATSKGLLFEDLPAIAGQQLVILVEDDEVNVVCLMGKFQRLRTATGAKNGVAQRRQVLCIGAAQFHFVFDQQNCALALSLTFTT